ncbi:MAG: FAD-dependent oxidoreductase [Betaproteobacteria bacterium]|nr:FAD-dependent oxidoreductase [Betaproteobacteria bacterium]
MENLDQRVAVIGAGYAGMAAAVTLAQEGVRVTVLEAGPVPGGRARRISSEGRELDNGQHILIGAYGELLRLMRLVAVPAQALLRLPLELRYADGFAFRSLWLPAPLGLLGGLLFASKLTLAERWDAVRFMGFLQKNDFHVEQTLTVLDLLQRHRQNGTIGHYLWRPLCVSALNTPPELASAQVFANVLRDSLAGEREASDLLLPRVDLSRLFPEPACEFVARRGGEIRTGALVRDLAAMRRKFRAVIVAVGPHQLKALLPELAGNYQYQPIYTCYLQYPASVRLPFPMLGLAEGLVQWAFDRGALTGERGRIACVISAQGDHQQLQRDELAAACHRELARALGGLPDPEWSCVIAEKRATVACTREMKSLNLRMKIEGVYLAGDYTDPDYPPTLEAAVRSGVRAAQLALAPPCTAS